MGQGTEPSAAPRWGRLRWAAWAAFAVAWSLALLLPVPDAGVRAVGQENTFLVSKLIHLGGYTVLTLLGLALPGWWRWAGLAFASLHAGGSEFCQWLLVEWMHRHGCWEDVGLDHIGIAAGLLAWCGYLKLSPKYWRGSFVFSPGGAAPTSLWRHPPRHWGDSG